MENYCMFGANKREARYSARSAPHETGKEESRCLLPRDWTLPEGSKVYFTSQLSQFKGEPRRHIGKGVYSVYNSCLSATSVVKQRLREVEVCGARVQHVAGGQTRRWEKKTQAQLCLIRLKSAVILQKEKKKKRKLPTHRPWATNKRKLHY